LRQWHDRPGEITTTTVGHPSSRADEWREQLSSAFGHLRPERIQGPDHGRPSDALDGAVRARALGRAGAFVVRGTPQVVRRTRAAIAEAPADPLKLCIQRTGRAVVHQGDVEVAINPGEMALYDTGRPYDLRLEGGWTCWVMTLPRDALGLPARTVSAGMTRAFSADAGPGAVLAHLVSSTVETAEDLLSGPDQLGEAGFQLMSSLLRSPGAAPVESADVLRAEVLTYVQAHLHDADLCHARVAAAHGLSPRSLHRLFEGEAHSVVETIRSLRLEGVRAELLDPLSSTRSTMAIARHWGYHDQAHFSRAFRTRFGVTPTTLRREALSGQPAVMAQGPMARSADRS